MLAMHRIFQEIKDMTDTEKHSESQRLLDIKGKFLVATPGMPDPRFEKAVIFMLEYDHHGAMGIIVNKLFDAIDFQDLMEQLGAKTAESKQDVPIYFGGPVEIGRGFVLHSPDVMLGHSVRQGNLCVTASIEMLSMLAEGKGPEKSLFTLGFSSWDDGQLDAELKENAWLIVPASTEILFETPASRRWEKALKLSGIDAMNLSASSGQA